MQELPLKNAILAYAGKKPARFHMPGHKGRLSPFDVTEVEGTDNLHSPHEAILESEKLCAKMMGARDAFFLVSGSTAGNLSMLMLLGSGKRVLLGRNCHKSVINGIALAGHEAVPLLPDEDGTVSANSVAEALDITPCDAVFITSPSYRGAISPIDEIAKAAHSRGALLFVDSAHGAHFALSEMLPAIPNAADAWCVSCHKTLNAFTQTAVLLTGESCPYTREKVQSTLNMFQSTSPSYPLMLSIESSVLEAPDWDAHIRRILSIRKRIQAIDGAVLLGSDDPSKQDITRLNIGMRGMRGRELERELELRGIVPEMSDSECVTLITTPSDRDGWYCMLKKALAEIASSAKAAKDRPLPPSVQAIPGRSLTSVRSAVTGETELCGISDSIHRICAQAAGCYPPGVAVLFPGEEITKTNAALLLKELSEGAELFGLENGMIRVVKERLQ